MSKSSHLSAEVPTRMAAAFATMAWFISPSRRCTPKQNNSRESQLLCLLYKCWYNAITKATLSYFSCGNRIPVEHNQIICTCDNSHETNNQLICTCDNSHETNNQIICTVATVTKQTIRLFALSEKAELRITYAAFKAARMDLVSLLAVHLRNNIIIIFILFGKQL